MTGGQMAPTTLPGMKTTSSPIGRDVETTGFPIRMCELLAHDGGRDLRRAAQPAQPHGDPQSEERPSSRPSRFRCNGYGLSLVELLSSCPTNWDMPPVEALKWIETQMVPVYPLGDFKNVKH